MAETADRIVVGGGIVGCAVVQHCAELLPAGARIVLLDRGPVAGATSGSCMGHLMVTPDDAQEYAFSATSVKLWAELQEREGGFDYNPTGALYLADDPADVELFAVLQKQFADHGDLAEILDAKQLRELEPGLAHDLPGALFYRGDGVVLPMMACGAMLRQAKKQNPNVDVRPHTPVTGMLRQGDRIVGVQTANGAIHAEHVVNCCGVWAPELAEMAGQPRLPIVPRAGNLAITGHHARESGMPVTTSTIAHSTPPAVIWPHNEIHLSPLCFTHRFHAACSTAAARARSVAASTVDDATPTVSSKCVLWSGHTRRCPAHAEDTT